MALAYALCQGLRESGDVALLAYLLTRIAWETPVSRTADMAKLVDFPLSA